MNKLFQNLTIQEILIEVLPSFGIALIVAEVYYKLGSFTLECIAFLATWYAAGMAINKLKQMVVK